MPQRPPKKITGGRYTIHNEAGPVYAIDPKVECRANGESVELLLYGTIGEWWDINARSVSRLLKENAKKPVTIRLNTYGGEVFEATAIHNLIKNHKPGVDVIIDGVAASAGVHLALGGKTVSIAENAMLMIHNPWGICVGEASDMQSYATMLEKVRESIITSYKQRSELSEDKLREMMDEETWMTAEEAKEYGFVDAIAGQSEEAPPKDALPDAKSLKNQLGRMVAKVRLSAEHLESEPEDVPADPVTSTQEDSMNPKIKAALFSRDMIEKVDASDEVCQAAVNAFCKAKGQDVPKEDAKILDILNGAQASESTTEPTDPTKPGSEGQPVDDAKAERERIKEIIAICEKAKCDDLADKFINSGDSIDNVRATVMDRMLARHEDIPDDDDENTGGGKPKDGDDPDAKYEAAYAKYKADGGTCSKESFVNSMKIDAGEMELAPAGPAN